MDSHYKVPEVEYSPSFLNPKFVWDPCPKPPSPVYIGEAPDALVEARRAWHAEVNKRRTRGAVQRSLAVRKARVERSAIPWEKLEKVPDDELDRYTICLLRKYAAKSLGIQGASRLLGGKPVLIQRITEARRT